MNPYQQFIFLRTYARYIDELGRRETWEEAVERYMSYMKGFLGKKLSPRDYKDIRGAILRQEVVPSMRLLWSAGPAVDRHNAMAFNCTYMAISKLRDFAEILYLLTCGSGVGFSVESRSILGLSEVSKQTGGPVETHVVADSREGWADALYKGLQTWFSGGDIKFDYSKIRPLGARLKTMGGRASGPQPLKELLTLTRNIVLSRQGLRLRPVDVHDICTKIGEVVVSGGTRRSAMISLSDLGDEEMRHAKTGRFWESFPHRAMANNSAIYEEKPSSTLFLREWVALMESGTGERGIFNRGSLPNQLPVRREATEFMGCNPCVTGDTIIATVEGGKSIKELADKNNDVLVYSWHPETKEPVVRWMRNPRKTRKDAAILEVTFDSGLKVRCTPDHNFYSFLGQKIQAKDLEVGKSIRAWSMSLDRDGHLRVHGWDSERNKSNHKWVARMIWECYHESIPEGYIIHHKNEDKSDNRIKNLGLMTEYEHQAHHYPIRYANGVDGKCKNHKVVSIKEAGCEDVYNGTVDDSHSYIILDPEPVAGISSGVVSANCGEINLRSKQMCNLSEVIARENDTKNSLKEKIRIATIMGTYQSMLTNFNYLSSEWKKNCDEERLLGVSVTGQMDCPIFRNNEYVMKHLKDYAREVNENYAKKFGIEPSKAITTTKPSGTVSQLVNASSGLHPRFSKYYIRRVRISSTDPLFHLLRDSGAPCKPEVGQEEDTAHTWVLEFPVASPEGSITADEVSAIDQLKYWKRVKLNYTEHNPSCTILVEDNEWLEVGSWVYKNWDIIGGLSFLPKDGHAYQLAPYEKITKTEYDKLVKRFPKIDYSKLSEKEDNTEGSKELACTGNTCEII